MSPNIWEFANLLVSNLVSNVRGCLGEGRLGLPCQVWELSSLPSFPSFPREIAILKTSGKTPASSRHPSSRHPRPSDRCLQFSCGSALWRSFAPLGALLRSLAVLHLRSFALICALLRSFARICVFLGTTAFWNDRVWELQNYYQHWSENL